MQPTQNTGVASGRIALENNMMNLYIHADNSQRNRYEFLSTNSIYDTMILYTSKKTTIEDLLFITKFAIEFYL